MLSGKKLRQYLAYAVHGRTEAPARKPPAQAKRATPRRGPARDAKYLNYIRSLPCAACQREGRSEAAHFGDHGISQKASDYQTIPLCAACHRTGRRSYHCLGREGFERAWRVCCAEIARGLRAVWDARAA